MPQVITRFHNLRRIDMMGCYMVTAPVIEKFCAAKVVFKRMESINMEALPELKDKAVSKLARITPKLLVRHSIPIYKPLSNRATSHLCFC